MAFTNIQEKIGRSVSLKSFWITTPTLGSELIDTTTPTSPHRLGFITFWVFSKRQTGTLCNSRKRTEVVCWRINTKKIRSHFYLNVQKTGVINSSPIYVNSNKTLRPILVRPQNLTSVSGYVTESEVLDDWFLYVDSRYEGKGLFPSCSRQRRWRGRTGRGRSRGRHIHPDTKILSTGQEVGVTTVYF